MVVALPLIDRVAGVEVAALVDELGGVGEAPGVPDDVLEPVDEVPAVSDEALGALVWTATPAGEHPNRVAEKTNTVMAALDNLMSSSLVERIPYVAGRRHFPMTGA